MKLGAIANIFVEKQDGYRLSGKKLARAGSRTGDCGW
jgi:hypothetical protein